MQWCENGKLVYVEDAGHWILHEKQEAVTAMLLDFLQEMPLFRSPT